MHGEAERKDMVEYFGEQLNGVESMIKLIERAALKIPVERLWVKPDCGLKTRKWSETERSLTRRVEATKVLRREYAQLEA